MKNRILYTALLALCASAAMNVGAQTTSPGSTTPGATPSTPPSTVTTPGTTYGTTPGTMNRNGTTTMGTTPGTATPNGTSKMGRMSDEDIRAYTDARNACSSQPTEQQQACNDAANQRYSSVSPKCQQLTGTALGDCLRGTEH